LHFVLVIAPMCSTLKPIGLASAGYCFVVHAKLAFYPFCGGSEILQKRGIN